MILGFLRRIIIPPLWAIFRRIPGGVRFWQWCTKILRISPNLKIASAEQIAIAQTPDFYDRNYFEKHKNPLEESGYDGYEPGTLEPEVAEAAKQILEAKHVLDVGCAKGFMVAAMRKVGLDAWGVDFSEYAINQASPLAADYVSIGNVLDLDFPDNAFDLILCFETLEHLASDKVDQAIDQLYRVASGKVWITTPCMGLNDYGPPPGWPQGKIKEPYCPMYEADRDFPDPALLEHLPLDRRGFPLQGHITIASFRWWTERFLQHGFIRRGDLERRVNSDVEAARTGWLNCMVFEKTIVPTGQSAHVASTSVTLKTAAADAQTPLVWQPGQAGTVRSDPIHLEPGKYISALHVGITQIPLQASPWLKVLTCDIRSESGAHMHGLRTIRLSDFEFGATTEKTKLTATVPFGCNTATDIELGITCPARFLVELDSAITIQSVENG